MRLNLERVLDGDYIIEYRVFCNDVLVGFVAWRHDAPTPAWYFEGSLSLGLADDGGVHFWFLMPYQQQEAFAIAKFKRRFHATFNRRIA